MIFWPLLVLVSFGHSQYSQWSYSANITVNTSGLGTTGTISDFPLLVRLHSGNFDFLQAQAGGEDIRFANPGGDPLSYEIERWDQSGQVAEIWVKLDAVDLNNSSQFFQMYWGSDSAGSESNSQAVFETGNGFTAAWHMDEEAAGTGTSELYLDATSNANHGNDMVSSTSQTGMIGLGHGFNGTDDNIQVEFPTNLPASQLSVSGWMNVNAHVDWLGIVQHGWGSDGGWMIFSDASAEFFMGIYDGGQQRATYSGLATGTWIHFYGTYDGTTVLLYVNAVESGSPGYATTSLATADAVDISDGDNPFDGFLDEIRVESQARSADWIKLCYESQRSDQSIISIGA
ncbi:DUF2341 domain-containing protein, partial [Fibrobacterota bacterium]